MVDIPCYCDYSSSEDKVLKMIRADYARDAKMLYLLADGYFPLHPAQTNIATQWALSVPFCLSV